MTGLLRPRWRAALSRRPRQPRQAHPGPGRRSPPRRPRPRSRLESREADPPGLAIVGLLGDRDVVFHASLSFSASADIPSPPPGKSSGACPGRYRLDGWAPRPCAHPWKTPGANLCRGAPPMLLAAGGSLLRVPSPRQHTTPEVTGATRAPTRSAAIAGSSVCIGGSNLFLLRTATPWRPTPRSSQPDPCSKRMEPPMHTDGHRCFVAPDQRGITPMRPEGTPPGLSSGRSPAAEPQHQKPQAAGHDAGKKQQYSMAG